MYRRGGKQVKKKGITKPKSKPSTPEKSPPPTIFGKEENQSVRTITFQNGEIIEDTCEQVNQEENDLLIAKQLIKKIDKEIANELNEMKEELENEERKMINAIIRNYESLTRELRFSFDCDSVTMELPYVRRIYGVDDLIELKKKEDNEIVSLVKDINNLLCDCQKKSFHIDEMKKEMIQSIQNYNETTNCLIKTFSYR